jgi:small subunit ribosomal protein S13
MSNEKSEKHEKVEKTEKADKPDKKQKAEAGAAAPAPAGEAAPKKGGKKAAKAAEGGEAAPATEGKKSGKGKKPVAEEKPKDEIKYIVRVAGVDLVGTKTVKYALTGIKGIGVRASGILVRQAGVDPNAIMGYLPPEQVDKLRAVVDNFEANIPLWMLNRRRDTYTGEDKHLTGIDLTLGVKEDINLMKKIRCYRGIRHETGQKVRGQRTKSTGRTGATVGVVRKKEAPGAAGDKK